MLSLGEIFHSVYGVWRLAHLDPKGMAHLDATETGFWRSFQVAFLLLPLELLSLALVLQIRPSEAGLGRIVAVDLIGYAIAWMAFPLAAHYLVMALDKEREYVGYIVAYNWASTISGPLYLLLLLAIYGGVLSGISASIAYYGLRAALLFYGWFIARTALGTGILPAAGLVAIDFMIGRLLNVVIERMMF